MEKMFFGCKSLISLPDISDWNTYKVTQMNNMFNECISLVIFPDIEGWFTYRLKNKSGVFYFLVYM